jgi:hypothetical protein
MGNLGCMVMEKLDVNLTKSVDHENDTCIADHNQCVDQI